MLNVNAVLNAVWTANREVLSHGTMSVVLIMAVILLLFLWIVVGGCLARRDRT